MNWLCRRPVAPFVSPHDAAAPLDDWPHLMFVAPSVAPDW